MRVRVCLGWCTCLWILCSCRCGGYRQCVGQLPAPGVTWHCLAQTATITGPVSFLFSSPLLSAGCRLHYLSLRSHIICLCFRCSWKFRTVSFSSSKTRVSEAIKTQVMILFNLQNAQHSTRECVRAPAPGSTCRKVFIGLCYSWP